MKVLQFTGFHPNVGETFMIFASWSAAINQGICGNTFVIHRKSAKTVKFILCSFVIYILGNLKTIDLRTICMQLVMWL